MKKIIALLLALIMVFALVACGGEKEPDPTPDAQPSQAGTDVQPSDDGTADDGDKTPAIDTENPIKIGHLADLTGNEKSTGILGQKAVDLAVKLINANGGIAGRAVEVITKDCASDASIAATAVRELVENDGVVAIVGPTQIGHKQAVAAVAPEYMVPVMPYNGTPVFLTKKFEYFMSSGGGTAQMPTAMADYLYNELGYRTIICISQQGTAGKNYVGPLITNFEAMGGKVVGYSNEEAKYIEVPADATDIESYLMNLPEADALVGWLSGTQGVGLWKAWFNQCSAKMPLHGAVHGGFTDYFIWKQLVNTAPEVVEKAMEWGVYAPINYAYSVENEANAEFVEAWKAANNGAVPVGSNLPGAGYTSLLLLKAAIESIEGEITGEAIYAALQQSEANGAEGHTAFNGGKMAAKAVYIAKVVKLEDGSFNYEIVDTYEDVPVDGLVVGG